MDGRFGDIVVLGGVPLSTIADEWSPAKIVELTGCSGDEATRFIAAVREALLEEIPADLTITTAPKTSPALACQSIWV